MDHRVSITQLDEETYLKLDHRKKLHSHDFGLKWFEILWMWWTIFLPYGCLFCGFSFFVFSSDFVGFLWLRRQKSNFFKLDLRSSQIPLRFTKRSKIGLGTVFENHKKVSFNIASEKAYFYFKLIENIQNDKFGNFLRNFNFRSKSATRRVNIQSRQKFMENATN